MRRFKSILMSTNVIDEDGSWILTPNSVVVQLGDQIDPKKDDEESQKLPHFDVIYYTDHLQREARKNNCDFVSLIGNHEHMNIDKIRRNKRLTDIVSSRPVMHRINDYVFCHGILKKRHYDAMQYFNKDIEAINSIWSKYVQKTEMDRTERAILQSVILDKTDGVLYAKYPESTLATEQLMLLMGLRGIFIGHIRVKKIQVVNNIWFLDLYLKDSFYDFSYNSIVIKHGAIHVEPLDISYY